MRALDPLCETERTSMSDDTKEAPTKDDPEASPAATDTQPETTPPASSGSAATDAPAAPPYQILAQYVKDMSFENPNAPAVFTANQQPQTSLTLDVTTTSLGGRDVEVVLSIEAKAEHDGKTAYLLELAYAAVVRVGPIPKEALNALLYVEVPRMLDKTYNLA